MTEPLLTSAVRAHQAGDLAKAVRLYGEILRLEPRQYMALHGLGILHYQSGQLEECERVMALAIRANPSSGECFFIRGCALQRMGRPNEALICFDQVIALRPDYTDAHSNRGVALLTMNRLDEALEAFRSALELDSSNAAVWNNRGCVLVNLGRHAEAIPCFDNAVAREGRYAQALINRGSAHAALKDFPAAIADFERALAIDPDAPYVAGHLAHYRMQSCDWQRYAKDVARIAEGVRAGKRVALPFIQLAVSESPAEQLRCASIWCESDVPPRNPLWRGEKYRHDRLRIAYVSADFHAHATAALMAGVFEQHDRRQFDLTAISFGPDDGSSMRGRVRDAFDRFIDVRGKGDLEIAAIIRQLEIDIAVDLKGLTKENRAGIFAHRPAPVQVSYLGYPGTMAAPYMDYLIADRTVAPERDREFYRERIVWLPDSYQANTPRPSGDAGPTRGECGLPEQGFVFCCFNNSYKISPGIFTIWMRLLRAVRGSVLWLLDDNPQARENLRSEAQSRGIAPDRLIFAPRVAMDEHLARHRHAGLFLDTQPYGAHTTASDALWAGVPVLTVEGPTFAARVAASLLRAMDVPELITDDLAAYEALALRLAWEPGTLAAIRSRLRERRDDCALFDTARFTRHLESAFRAMAERHARGEMPEHIVVEADTDQSPSRRSPQAPEAALAGLEQARALRRAGSGAEAVIALDRALSIAPDFAAAIAERGAVLGELGQYSASAADFARALQLDPEQPWLLGNLILSRLHACDWRNLAELRQEAAQRIARGETAVAPFVDIAISDSPEEQWNCARLWATAAPLPRRALWNGEAYQHDRIRIAYLSGDFHAHATAALMAGVFEHHDRSRFEPIAVSFGPDDGSALRARVRSAFERFADMRGRSDSEIAAYLRQMEADIVVDLKGYTDGARPGILAHRPAPVQAAWLGYPGTTGAPWIDYLIADEIVVPASQRPFYSEQIVALPGSYQCNDARRPMAGPPPSRMELGLPESGFVFCCFNGSYKITPEMFGIWMQLLRDVPGSVLWLLDDNADAARNLRHEAGAAGIDPERLLFAPRRDVSEHLARHRAADLFLDTLPVGAHTTASDALWAGLPVLTLPGRSFASRVAASVLTAAGLPELIAVSPEAYRDTALRLARNPEELQSLRRKLAENRHTQPLFDTASFTRSLESAYATMWERSRRREAPQGFAVRAEAGRPAMAAAPIPDHAAAAFLDGCRFVREGNYPGALARFEEAVAAAPHFVEALTNLGGVLMALNRPADALAPLTMAVTVNPDMPEAWNNRGNALSALGKYEDAVASFDRVLALRPRLVEALINRGTALLALRRSEEALASYESALRENPDSGAALHGHANALFELQRFEEAAREFEAAIAADPGSDFAGTLAFTRLQCCDWRMLDHDRRSLAGANLSQFWRTADPFQYLALSASAEDQRRCAEVWVAAKHPPKPDPLWNGERYRHGRTRIAWLSADYRMHPVAQALAGVIPHLDKSRFESVGIGWGVRDDSAVRARLIASLDEFIPAERLTDAEVAQLIREREIDIAIDLMGFTAECRPGILAARPAPVQVSYLGFAGTMGAPYIDYLVADEMTVPDSESRFFSERIVRLPGCFFPVDNTRPVAPAPSRSGAGLPDRGFVFACFNNAFKYTPEMFDIWMRLLRQVEGSVLWLSAGNPAAQRNLKREAELRLVDPDRVVAAPYVTDPAGHLARLSLADLFLDTLPYNAHATAADALLAGVPVLTCRGSTFAGRVAASLVSAAGLPELVAPDLARYEQVALGLARDADALRELRERVAGARATALFDSTGYASRLADLLISLPAVSDPGLFFSTA